MVTGRSIIYTIAYAGNLNITEIATNHHPCYVCAY